MKKALKGLIGETYTLKDEKDEERPTRFDIRPLTGPEKAQCADDLIGPGGRRSTLGLIKACSLAITGWQNIEDPETGDDLPFSRKNFTYLEPEWLYEVGERIFDISTMGDQDRKNS